MKCTQKFRENSKFFEVHFCGKEVYLTELKLEIVKKYLLDHISFEMLSKEHNFNNCNIYSLCIIYYIIQWNKLDE
ncbi:hypothetical protein IRP63_04960 [Clostridium botulinum]|uniref:Uncharacterized protein n=1 Tax=Clostridium botulinum C/D str. DC5 TaxID=1443128 RepID=A0A0A0IFP1_CLOBO|nr:hypothetical protein [Clostridium botulinum]KGN00245.1 hypothetical protein Z955_04435 [Clostridium botulinum C/D str. DC5]MCD3321588.1 hypothetical protein [Clostridium botulinum D/C]MCD3349006.1 hypothetical protein [Clostridium botulinum D/C]MCD3352684.1 hypothetical protein [Clostridium botulinum D/C]QPW58593.1 hypothetical protein IRP63_04960 [Clostridium botulinum]